MYVSAVPSSHIESYRAVNCMFVVGYVGCNLTP